MLYFNTDFMMIFSLVYDFIDPLSEGTDSSKHTVVIGRGARRVTPTDDTLLYPLVSGVLTNKGSSTVTKAATLNSLPSIPCTYHGGSNSSWSVNGWVHVHGLAHTVGYHTHWSLLQLCSSRTRMIHLSPTYKQNKSRISFNFRDLFKDPNPWKWEGREWIYPSDSFCLHYYKLSSPRQLAWSHRVGYYA